MSRAHRAYVREPWLAESNFRFPCYRTPNHVEGAIRGVAAVYQRGEFLPERKAALEAWAGHVLGCARREAEQASASGEPLATRAGP